MSSAVQTSSAPRLTAADLKEGMWVALQDEYSGAPGELVKVAQIDGDRVFLQHDDGMDIWGGRIEGEVTDETLPIYGWVQT